MREERSISLIPSTSLPVCTVRALLAMLLALGVVFPLGAQTTASIFGTITDQSGAVLPKAQVSATNKLTNDTSTTQTNSEGFYSFPALALGTYMVRAEVPGFRAVIQDGIELTLNRNAKVDLSLSVGAVSESIRVTADAPLVETTTNEMGAVVDRQRVGQLPLNGRNTLSLVALVPGAQTLQVINEQGYQNNKVSINGMRPEESNWLLDGGDNTTSLRNYGQDVPNPDAVQEFRVISNNYSAEYGRSVGAIVNVVTKSGTNEYHGSVFEFLRNRALNSRNFFEPDTTPLVQNQFGATLGGPVIKDRVFFFGSYQGFRRATQAFNNGAVVPTAAERSGNFSASVDSRGRPIVIRDPLTRQPFSGNLIPKERLNTVAVNFLNRAIPLPNDPARSPNALSARAGTPIDNNQYLGKVDYILSPQNRLSAAYFYAKNIVTSRFSGNIDFQFANTNSIQHNLNVHEYWTISPSMVNHLHGNLSRTVGLVQVFPSDVTMITLGARNFGPLPEGPIMPPSFNVTGYFNAATPGGGDRQSNKWRLADAVDWIRGRHSLKFGVEGAVVRFHDITPSGRLGGQFAFDGTFTGNGMGDLLLGQVLNWQYGPATDKYNDTWSLAGFVQDNFRASPKLVLNLGVRYDLDPYTVHPKGLLIAYVPGRQSTCVPQAPSGVMFPCDPGIPRAGIKNDNDNFSPRVGFAYDLTGAGKTVVRGGYAIAYQTTINNVQQEGQVSIPFFIRETMRNVNAAGPSSIDLSDPWRQIGGAPYPISFDPANLRFPATGAYSFADFNLRTGYVQQYNLSVQRQFGRGWMLEAGYVGNVGRKLTDQRDINAPISRPGASAANADARRPLNPPFLVMRATEGQANSAYNSGQVRLERRFSKGFTLLGSYTFGRSIDLASWHDSQSQWVDPRNLRLNRGLSDFNRTHTAVFSWLWELPKPPGMAGALVGGWSLNGIAAFYSGAPVGGGTASNGIVTGRDNDFDGNSSNDRPNLVGDWRLPKPSNSAITAGSPWFNIDAFQPNTPGAIGNLGRNNVLGPASQNIDLGIFRSFRITERHRLEVRGEFFNLFNWVTLGTPVFSLANANFGKVLTAGAPRIIQVGLKYSF